MLSLQKEGSPGEMKAFVTKAFKCKFQSRNGPSVDCWEVLFPSMEYGEVVTLENPFSEEEIRREFMEADGAKTPGLDGFTFKFIQSFWNVFKDDVLALF